MQKLLVSMVQFLLGKIHLQGQLILQQVYRMGHIFMYGIKIPTIVILIKQSQPLLS